MPSSVPASSSCEKGWSLSSHRLASGDGSERVPHTFAQPEKCLVCAKCFRIEIYGNQSCGPSEPSK